MFKIFGKVKNFLKNKKIKLLFEFIILFLVIVLVYKNFYKIKKDFLYEKENIIKENNNAEYNNKIDEIDYKIELLKKKIEINELTIKNLQADLTKLQNQNPINNTNNIKIIININKILDKIYTNNSFNEEYELLKAMSKNDLEMYNEIIKIENFLDYNASNINEIFNNELNNFPIKVGNDKDIKNNSIINNIFTFFVKNNIKITKINNIDENKDNKVDILLYNLTKSISNKDYVLAKKIITKNSLNEHFLITIKYLDKINNLKSILFNLLENIYNKY